MEQVIEPQQPQSAEEMQSFWEIVRVDHVDETRGQKGMGEK